MDRYEGLRRWARSPECRAHSRRVGFKPTHGASIPGSPLHGAWQSWRALKTRCNNPNQSEYHRYGGRGITYDPRWESFEVFVEDMGPRPPGHTIDRIDNDGPYAPGNCRWVTVKEQRANQTQARGWTVSRPRTYGTKPMVCNRCHIEGMGHAAARYANWLCPSCSTEAKREQRARSRERAKARAHGVRSRE